MQFKIVKNITPKKNSPVGKLLQPVMFLILVPVFIIAFLSSLLVSFFIFLKSLIRKDDTEIPSFHEELILIENPDLKILMIEDENDEELTALNEAWAKTVFGQHTYLYRIRTTPVISGLNDTICGYYTQENKEGVFLQQINPDNQQALNTRIIFLNYQLKSIEILEEIGSFYLYNDEKTGEIKGFNESEQIELKLITSY